MELCIPFIVFRLVVIIRLIPVDPRDAFRFILFMAPVQSHDTPKTNKTQQVANRLHISEHCVQS